MILFVNLKVIGEVSDPIAQDPDLDLGRARILFMVFKLINNLLLGFGRQDHFPTSFKLPLLRLTLVSNPDIKLSKLSTVLQLEPPVTHRRDWIAVLFPCRQGAQAPRKRKGFACTLGSRLQTLDSFT
jgi:hypothetical protein